MTRRNFFKAIAGLVAAVLAKPGHALSVPVHQEYIPPLPELKPGMPRVGIVAVGGMGRKILSSTLLGLPNLHRSILVDTDVPSHKHINLHISLRNGTQPPKSTQEVRVLAESAASRISACVQGLDVLFVVTDLGSVTGSGAAPVVARIAKEAGVATVVSIPYLFFASDGMDLNHSAEIALRELRAGSHLVIPVSHRQWKTHFTEGELKSTKLANHLEEANECAERIYSTITACCADDCIVSLDFDDMKTLLGDGYCRLGFSRTSGSDDLKAAIHEACMHPMMGEPHLAEAKGIHGLIELRTDDKSLEKIHLMIMALYDAAPGATVTISAYVNTALEGECRVTLLAA